MKDISELLKLFKIKPNDIEVYKCAFTHSSYNADMNTKHHDYERLEFLGDSVLGLVVAELAYEIHNEMSQGLMTKLKSSLVSTNSLANYSKKFHFDEYVLVGNSYSGKVSDSNHLLEDVFEAFMGAIYMDQGFDKVKSVIITIFYKDIKSFRLENLQDYKSKLQEEIQAEHREAVTYEIVSETGPSHEKVFTIRVLFDGIELGRGEGTTKKQAEQMAAKEALAKRAVK